MSTFDRIAHVLTDHCGIVSSCVTPGTRINELGFDSLDLADFFFDIEEEKDADMDFDRDPLFQKVGTLQELADAIDKQRSARAG